MTTPTTSGSDLVVLDGDAALEQRFLLALESISLIAAGIDVTGRVTFANAFLLDLTGWTHAEVVGNDWFELFDDNPAVRADYFECMRRGMIRPHFESAIRTRSGALREIRWSSILERDERGDVTGIVTLGEDVTERVEAEHALREREEHFRSLIENASDVISVLTPDGTSLYESPSVERMLGWKPDELVGRENFSMVHPDEADQMAEYMAALVDGREMSAHQFRLRHRDGTWRWVEGIGRLHRRGPQPVMITNYRDVTEQRELREQLLHSQKLEAVGRLAGGVAHDFNNLLTAISGYAEFLVAGFGADDPRREDAQEICRAADRAAGLTRQLLAFSRRQVLQPETLDVAEVVAGIEALLGRLLDPSIELATAVEEGCFVEADRGQVEQVLTNLVVNASDAMPEGGPLSIRARRLVGDEGPVVELSVADTGEGMDQDTRERAFEPFFTTKDKSKGTGLGLATVYGIVAQSGGSITIDSELGVGSCVRIVLPLAAAPVPEPVEPLVVEQVELRSETILLVEDEAMIRRLARDVLGRAGFNVLDAPEGEQALVLLRANHVDLLLTDVVMPGMSGPDLARIAVSERPSLRVLFTSGYTNEPEELLAEPDAAFIGKPFSPQSLVAKVREVLEARQPA